MGTAATPVKTEKQPEVSQALKCMSKRKKNSLYAQSKNELHCKSVGAEKKLESRMSVRHWNGTGILMQISSSQIQPLSSVLAGHTRGVCLQWIYEHSLPEQLWWFRRQFRRQQWICEGEQFMKENNEMQVVLSRKCCNTEECHVQLFRLTLQPRRRNFWG